MCRFLFVTDNLVDLRTCVFYDTFVAPCSDAKDQIVAFVICVVVAHGMYAHARAFTLFDKKLRERGVPADTRQILWQ